MSITIGIDPGLTGAIALVDSYGVLVDAYDMPVAGKLVSARLICDLEDWGVPGVGDFGTVVIEDVHAMPKQGVTSTFSFGRSKGVVEGVFGAIGLPIVYAPPSRWKRDMGVTGDKDLARRRAIELWPSKAGLFKRKLDVGRADAALIALWFVKAQR